MDSTWRILVGLAAVILFWGRVITTQTEVMCYSMETCAGPSPVAATVNDCCNHNAAPVGLSYEIQATGVCQACPSVFGFAQASFVCIEREESYMVEFGFLSGPVTTRFFSIPLNLVLGTTSSLDVDLLTTRVRFFSELPLQRVFFQARVDGVAQEGNETFSLSAVMADPFEFGDETVIVDIMNGTILDNDSEIHDASVFCNSYT